MTENTNKTSIWDAGGFGDEDLTELALQENAILNVRKLVGEISEMKGRPLTACVRSFGCQMNARDSEKLSGVLLRCGYLLTDDEDADLVIFNTCTVRDTANTRVYGRLGQIHHFKKSRKDMIVCICGCMPQAEGAAEEIHRRFPFIDIIFGTHNLFRFATLLYEKLSGGGAGKNGTVIEIWKDTQQIVEGLPVRREYPWKSGVNISFGCNNFCTYCIVPYVRGRERSRSPREIIHEIERLSEDGVIEIMLLGQNVNSYGNDIPGGMRFPELLARAAEVSGIERVRFMTSHPKDLSDELIDVMAGSPKIADHLHLPVQSGSSRVLHVMNRRYTKEDYLALVERIRAKMPDISLTTDIIVGFPGETENDFLETLDLVRKVRYDSAFTFLYSVRSGTLAAGMPDQIPHEIAQERFDRLLTEVQQIANETIARHVGKTMTALVESTDPKEPGMLSGRLGNNIMIHFPGPADRIGTMVPVRILEQHGFYYTGEIAE